MTIQMQFLVAALLFIISWHSSAQTTFQRTFGGSGYDYGRSVQQTSDGGYVVVGTTSSFWPFRLKVYLIKTNVAGDTLWTKSFGGSRSAQGYSVQETNDGGYIITGDTDSFGTGTSDVYLIKTNANGDTLWTRTYGGSWQDNGFSVRQTRDGGYVVAGLTNSFTAGSSDAYLIRTNATGDTLWTRSFGGSNYEEGRCVRQTSDGGYVMTGLQSFGTSGWRVWLIKTNASGDTIWTRTFGNSNYYDSGSSVEQTTDGGYVIAGTDMLIPGPVWAYLIRTDSIGNELWSKRFSREASGNPSAQQTNDGGYVVATSLSYSGNFDVYLAKMNAAGDTMWTRTIGGSGYDDAWSVQQTIDGGYVIAGSTSSFGAGQYDVYLIKTNANGVVTAPKELSTPRSFALENNYPNPFNPSTRIGFEVLTTSFVSLKVFNVLGQEIAGLVNEVKQAGKHEVTWNASGQASGVYCCRLQADGFATTKKLILVR